MSTLDDLRRTLERHASDLADDDAPGRVIAVRDRATRVRRRRAAGVTAAAVVLVALVAVVTVLPGGDPSPEPAEPDRTLGGFTAPPTMESLGRTYEYVGGTFDPERATLDLTPSDRPRLVSWATGGDGVKIYRELVGGGPGDWRWTSSDTGFDDFTQVYPGWPVSYTARAEEVALAVYELVGEGRDFREEVAGASLIDSVVGDPGEAELRLSIPALEGSVRLSGRCSSGEAGYVHMSVNGKEIAGYDKGCDDTLYDPGAYAHPSVDGDAREPLDLRLWVTRGQRGELLADDDLRLTLGAYRSGPLLRLAGFPVADHLEFDGHLFALADTLEAPTGADEISAGTREGVPTMALVYWRGAGRGAWVSGAGTTRGDRGSDFVTYDPVTDGSSMGASASGAGPAIELCLAIYQRVD